MPSVERFGKGLLISLSLAGALLSPSASRAQGDVLPGAKRPALEPFQEKESIPRRLDLPPLPPPSDTGRALPYDLRVRVREFRIEGSSVFSREELAEVTAAWSGREISSAELLQARDAVTQFYVDAGYLSSIAIVPDQRMGGDVVILEMIEGALEAIEIEGTERYRPEYFRTRLGRAAGAPVNVFEIERQLQIFQRDPQIASVRARFDPGSRPGLSRLRLVIVEAPIMGLGFRFSNGNSPSVGGYTGEVAPRIVNVIGYGDVWSGDFQFSEGLLQLDLDFSVPLPPYDTRLGLHFQTGTGRVVEEGFEDTARSKSNTFAVSLSQPVVRTRVQELVIGVRGELRRSKTVLVDFLCFPSFLDTSESDCESKTSVLRFFGEWKYATLRNAVAARSVLSVGLDALGATNASDGLPDSEYVAWLGQVQWARRLPLGSELLARADAQLATKPLVGIEKFAVGGMHTVRGYRENQFVRDNGFVASIEMRVPLWYDARRRPALQLAHFMDYGRSWDTGAGTESIWSVGVGLRAAPVDWLRAELYWGYALEGVREVGDDIQNDGIHFELTVVPF